MKTYKLISVLKQNDLIVVIFQLRTRRTIATIPRLASALLRTAQARHPEIFTSRDSSKKSSFLCFAVS